MKSIRLINIVIISTLLVFVIGCTVSTDSDEKSEKIIITWYKDADKDGYSDGTTIQSATQPEGYYKASDLTAISGDCNDNDKNINPEAKEIPDDGIDQNCNGKDLVTWYKDADKDGYSDGTTIQSENQPQGYYIASDLIGTSGDCNDNNPEDCILIKSTSIGEVLKYRYSVNGTPFDTVQDFNFGPNIWNNTYSDARHFFHVQKTNGQIGIVWQDSGNQSVRLTWAGADLKSHNTVELPNSSQEILTVATYDEKGYIYYLTIQSGSGVNTDSSRTSTFYKVSDSGQTIVKQSLDTSKDGLNIVEYDNASLRYSNGNLALMLGRTMHKSDDGLNHQGGIAVVFDSANLNIKKNWGQTSGHSFESFMTVNSDRDFVGIDLGDNYPRGVHLHKFNDIRKESRIVYTFKTEHSEISNSPAGKNYPVYSEISGSGTTYYKWSNDNRTYTELGGVIEVTNGYITVFAGEASPQGRALDNYRVGSNLNDPRNIGLTKIISNFGNLYSCVVPDDIVLTSGITETGGFYTFGGSWTEQRNTGVVWLTDYKDKNQENVSRLKIVKLNDSSMLLLWEKWTPDTYVNTYAMKIDGSGKKLTEPIELGNHVRLNRRDDLWVIGNVLYLIVGDKKMGKLDLIVFQLKSTTTTTTTGTSTTTTSGTGTASTTSSSTGSSSDPLTCIFSGGVWQNGQCLITGTSTTTSGTGTASTTSSSTGSSSDPLTCMFSGGVWQNGQCRITGTSTTTGTSD